MIFNCSIELLSKGYSIMPLRSYRLDALPPYVFSVIGDRIQKMQADGLDVFRLDIGSPDMPPPDAVLSALNESVLKPNNHGYSGYRGISAFRQAVADYYFSRFGVVLDPHSQILPLIGTKEGIVNLCLAYLSPGDISLIPDISYPSYAMGTRLAGADICWIPLKEDKRFRLDIGDIPKDVLDKAKLLWVNYPNNPTGVMVDLSFYRELIEFCQKYDILLVSDNPYVDVTFGEKAVSALQASEQKDHVIEFFSFSKSYNMAGWRLGVALGSAEAIANLLRIKSNVDSGHFKPVYEAGMVALATPQEWIDKRNQIYQSRRDLILDALPDIGLSAGRPDGTLYVWAKVVDGDVARYVEQALLNAHVSLAPGLAYGPGGGNFVRISISLPNDRLESAMTRLKTWYAARN